MHKFSIILLLFTSATFVVSASSDKEDKPDVFIPTKEWQVIKPGQSIGKGLHVRINLETGLKEAKLMDDSNDNTQMLTIDEEEIERSEKRRKNLEEDYRQTVEKYKTYLELKHEMKGLSPKTDAELITQLVQRHKKFITMEDENVLLSIIEDLDYLAHQFDNAIEFVKLNGFNELIYPNLNSTQVKIKRATLRLMASLMQNNVKPKVHALETNALPVLLRIITLDSDPSVKTSAIFTLGSLLRGFPIGQIKFLQNGGFEVFSQFLSDDYKDKDIKMQTKLITLISDMIDDKNYAAEETDEINQQLYASIDWFKYLKQYNWCTHLNNVFNDLVRINHRDHDALEKCLIAMKVMKSLCLPNYSRDVLISMESYYEKEHSSRSEDRYFGGLRQHCRDILNDTPVKTEL